MRKKKLVKMKLEKIFVFEHMSYFYAMFSDGEPKLPERIDAIRYPRHTHETLFTLSSSIPIDRWTHGIDRNRFVRVRWEGSEWITENERWKENPKNEIKTWCERDTTHIHHENDVVIRGVNAWHIENENAEKQFLFVLN